MSEPATSSQPPGLAASGIAFRPELERLRAQRSAPSLELEYTIGGGTEQAVHQKLDALRERRIGAMENRLRDAKGHAENAFGVAQVHERAAHDFDRAR